MKQLEELRALNRERMGTNEAEPIGVIKGDPESIIVKKEEVSVN